MSIYVVRIGKWLKKDITVAPLIPNVDEVSRRNCSIVPFYLSALFADNSGRGSNDLRHVCVERW